MRRTAVVASALSLLLPAGASAKGGVIFDRYPDVQAVGAPMKFTVMLGHRDARPLVTFRNPKTREIVRVRGSRSDLNGIAYGTVALPSHGPWRTTVSVGGRLLFFEGDSEPFRVGVGLTQTIPAADAGRREPEPSAGGSPWPWIAAAAAGSAMLLLLMLRSRLRGAA